jgi:predicted dehydrogenase
MADADEVIARDDIDGVVISTIDHWHVPLAYKAALAGKDMYVEKPLSLAMAWSWKLREAVKRNKVVFQYGTQQRSSGAFQRAIDLVRNGYIGEVQRVEAWCPDMSTQFKANKKPPFGSNEVTSPPEGLDYDRWIGPAPMKPYTVDRCTKFGGYHIYDYALGFIAGWGAHPLDIAQWGLGTDHTGPVRYEGAGDIPPGGSLWNSIESWDVNCEYANGVTMRFMGSRVAKESSSQLTNRPPRDHGTTFFGAEGWVSVDRGGCYYNHRGQPVNAYQVEHQASDQLVYKSPSQARNFIDCVKSRQPTISPLESAIRGDTISHLSDICIRTGRPIRWDPAKERIKGDDEATRMLDRSMREPWVM